MGDIFENKVLCNKCEKVMRPVLVSKNGFNLRALKCDKCNEVLIHPQDKIEYDEFMRLKQKEYEVKMRMVGNSYTVSIPKEMVSFMREQKNIVDSMVKMCFTEPHKISMAFNSPENEKNKRVVSSKEVRIIKDGKVFHAKQVMDSANPQNNKKVILRNDLEKENEEDEE